jgi:hypothetical protein
MEVDATVSAQPNAIIGLNYLYDHARHGAGAILGRQIWR